MSIDNTKIRELAKSLKTWQQVLINSIREANMTQESVQLLMKYDKGTFSRILSGQAHFPPERLNEFNEIVGHSLTLHWLCYREGYEAHVLPKLLEKQIKEKDEELMEREERISYLEDRIEWFKETIEALGRNIKRDE